MEIQILDRQQYLVQSQKGTEAILEKKTRIDSCFMLSYFVPAIYLYMNNKKRKDNSLYVIIILPY